MVSETRTRQPAQRNVLEDLDSRIPANFYWYLADHFGRKTLLITDAAIYAVGALLSASSKAPV